MNNNDKNKNKKEAKNTLSHIMLSNSELEIFDMCIHRYLFKLKLVDLHQRDPNIANLSSLCNTVIFIMHDLVIAIN